MNSAGNVGIAGAEASLLEWLSSQEEYQNIANEYWPSEKKIHFHQVRDDGRNLNKNMDLIKSDLMEFIRLNDIQTLFLSLGGGAKILGYEIAKEMGVRIVDFGAMIRALCDLGSDGHLAARSTHSIMFFRLPFELVMQGIEETQGELNPEELLARAHAQLIHQLRSGEIAISRRNRDLDFSYDARKRFSHSYKSYTKQYNQFHRVNNSCIKERNNFFHFCGLHRLTMRGVVYYTKFKIKTTIKRMKISQIFYIKA